MLDEYGRQGVMAVWRTIFTTMKKLLFLGACLVALASQPVKAQTSAPDIILVRYDRVGAAANLRIAITRGEGKTELSEVKSGYSEKGFLATSEAEYKILKQLYQEGYTLLNSSTEPGGAVSWIFVKAH